MSVARGEMQKQAKSIGIQIASSVNSKTDYLVIGQNVGQKKIEDAKKFDVKVITEQQYRIKIIK